MVWPSIREFCYRNVRSKSNRTIQKKFVYGAMPLQVSEEPAPSSGEYWPAGQGVQEEALVSAHEPGAHTGACAWG